MDSSINKKNKSTKKISFQIKKKYLNDNDNLYLNNNEKVKINNIKDSFNAETDTSSNNYFDINKYYSSQDENIDEIINNNHSNFQILNLLKCNL